MALPQKNEQIGPILRQLNEARKIVDVPREDVPYAVKEGWGLKRRDALDTIQTLKKKLKDLVIPSHLVGLYVTGPNEVLEALSGLIGTYEGLSVNANQAYLDIAEELKPTFGSDHMVKLDTFMKLNNLYYGLAKEYELQELPPLQYSETECPKFPDLVDYVKTQIRTAIGDRLAVKVLTRAILNGILKNELSGKYIPIMVTQASDADKNALNKLFIKTTDLELKTIEEATKETLMKIVKKALAQ